MKDKNARTKAIHSFYIKNCEAKTAEEKKVNILRDIIVEEAAECQWPRVVESPGLAEEVHLAS
jgi:hypothetical protein